jgi:hypothetical protein
MRIHSFGIYGYRGRQDWEWNESFSNPSWNEVEAAIRRLDANEFAGVGFKLSEVYPGDTEQPSLHVTGGQGQYIISYSGGGGSSVHYVDPNKVGQQELVGVVRRDQGVWVPARWVCSDRELVVAIARFAAETGRPCPGVTWG